MGTLQWSVVPGMRSYRRAENVVKLRRGVRIQRDGICTPDGITQSIWSGVARVKSFAWILGWKQHHHGDDAGAEENKIKVFRNSASSSAHKVRLQIHPRSYFKPSTR
jgi:hypothetical protein